MRFDGFPPCLHTEQSHESVDVLTLSCVQFSLRQLPCQLLILFGDMSRCKEDKLIDACCSCARLEYSSGRVKTVAKILLVMSR